jgi:hypothetical protein
VGRHSNPSQLPFYRSVAAWFAPWLLVAAVAGALVWLAVGALGKGSLEAHKSPARASSPSPSEARPSSSVAGGAGHSQKGGGEAGKQASPSPQPSSPEPLITNGITVQVLNATQAPGAGDRMAGKLQGLGYQVVAVQSAFGGYSHTTVYWSTPAYQRAAEALAHRFGWKAGPKPANLSSSVSIHVVVGSDQL